MTNEQNYELTEEEEKQIDEELLCCKYCMRDYINSLLKDRYEKGKEETKIEAEKNLNVTRDLFLSGIKFKDKVIFKCPECKTEVDISILDYN